MRNQHQRRRRQIRRGPAIRAVARKHLPQPRILETARDLPPQRGEGGNPQHLRHSRTPHQRKCGPRLLRPQKRPLERRINLLPPRREPPVSRRIPRPGKPPDRIHGRLQIGEQIQHRPPSQAWRARTGRGLRPIWLVSDVPAASKISSNTQRIVNTVGPASTGPAGVSTWRILPPTVAARSSTVTGRPAEASMMAAARPPAPAPIIKIWRGMSHVPQTLKTSRRHRVHEKIAGRVWVGWLIPPNSLSLDLPVNPP